MELEVSAWTRRDRLERIAAAERDRRAGRIPLALAALGEGKEWPARLVLALAKLPGDEGVEAREILEATLDDWAAESGLASLDPRAAAPEREAGEEEESERAAHDDDLVVDAVEALEEDLLVPATPVEAATSLESIETKSARGGEAAAASRASDPPSAAAALASPIEYDELERAFAEAEAQTDEMHGVNDVAERVLMDEPFGLAELDGVAYDAGDEVAAAVDAGTVSGAEVDTNAGIETDAAWAEAPIWPEPIAPEPPRAVSAPLQAKDEAALDAEGGRPTRAHVITTLERWLDNLRAGRAR